LGLSWSWLYGSWIYNYLCNQWQSSLKLWVRWRGVLDTTLCDKVCKWLATRQWFSQGTPISSTNKTDCHDINEILLKVVLNTINQSNLIETWWEFRLYFTIFDNIRHNSLSLSVWNQVCLTQDLRMWFDIWIHKHTHRHRKTFTYTMLDWSRISIIS
jgi:hypothetical protein